MNQAADADGIPHDEEAVPNNAKPEQPPDGVLIPAAGDGEFGSPGVNAKALGQCNDGPWDFCAAERVEKATDDVAGGAFGNYEGEVDIGGGDRMLTRAAL